MKATIEEQIGLALDMSRTRCPDGAWATAIAQFSIDRYTLSASFHSELPEFAAYKPGDTIYAVAGAPEHWVDNVSGYGLTLSEAMQNFFSACIAWHEKAAVGLAPHADLVATQLARKLRIEEFVSR